MGQHRQNDEVERLRWAWEWEGGKRTLSLLGWHVALWTLVAVLWLGLWARERMWHPDTTWVQPDRATLNTKD
jgi:hypothetical protein